MFSVRIDVVDTTELLVIQDVGFEGDSSHYDADSLLMLACASLAESPNVAFWIDGFGQNPWPTDVRTELSIFCEQLPELVRWLRNPTTNTHAVEFYEQGIERTLTFRVTDKIVEIECQSWSTWQPNPTIEEIDQPALVQMIVVLVNSFEKLVATTTPTIFAHPRFQEWLSEVTVV